MMKTSDRLFNFLPIVLLILPLYVLIDRPYGYNHHVLDWSCIALSCLITLLISSRCYLEANVSVARYFGVIDGDKCPLWLRLMVVIQVVAITYANFLIYLSMAFGEQIKVQASVQTKLAIHYAKMGCIAISILSLIPVALYTWLHYTRQDKQSEHDKLIEA